MVPEQQPPSDPVPYEDKPLPQEKQIARPEDPDSVMNVRYNPDGTVMREKDIPNPEDLGPPGMPATSPQDGPFSEEVVPRGWNRLPTAEEVAWLNEKYPAQIDDAGNRVGAPAAGPTPPEEEDLTGTITSFTAANPTTVTTDIEDEEMLEANGYVTLEALEGEQPAKDVINGQRVRIVSVGPTTLELDLSAVNVAGLTADYTREGPESEQAAR